MEPRMPAVEYRKRNSILGSLALMLSLPALALNYFEFPGLPHVTIASLRDALSDCDRGRRYRAGRSQRASRG